MDTSDEQDRQLEEVHDEVSGTKSRLGAIDERTKHILEQVDGLQEEIDSNAEDIDDLQGAVKRNTTILSAFTGGTTLALAWVLEQIGAIL